MEIKKIILLFVASFVLTFIWLNREKKIEVKEIVNMDAEIQEFNELVRLDKGKLVVKTQDVNTFSDNVETKIKKDMQDDLHEKAENIRKIYQEIRIVKNIVGLDEMKQKELLASRDKLELVKEIETKINEWREK